MVERGHSLVIMDSNSDAITLATKAGRGGQVFSVSLGTTLQAVRGGKSICE